MAGWVDVGDIGREEVVGNETDKPRDSGWELEWPSQAIVASGSRLRIPLPTVYTLPASSFPDHCCCCCCCPVDWTRYRHSSLAAFGSRLEGSSSRHAFYITCNYKQ